MPYALALAITLAVEVPVYLTVVHAARRAHRDGQAFARLLPGWRALGGAVGVNLVTHPLAWVVLTARPEWFVVVEVAVCLVEAFLLWMLAGLERSGRTNEAVLERSGRGAGIRVGVLLLATAVAANSASVLAGVLYGLIG